MFDLQAITARDSMAKSLYSALFDWIVLRINHALLNKKDMEESVTVSNKTKSLQAVVCLDLTVNARDDVL